MIWKSVASICQGLCFHEASPGRLLQSICSWPKVGCVDFEISHLKIFVKFQAQSRAKKDWMDKKCRECLTGVVAIGACVWPLALAEAPHGALVVVDTLLIDGIYMVLWGP